MAADSARISPTAHYTSYVWYRNGMSHPVLATPAGAVMHAALWPMNFAYERFGDRPSLDMMLLARHRVIDHLLRREIVERRVGQVVEIACGLGPRGLSFAARHPEVRYIEGDLPDMADNKRALLRGAGLLRDNHRVVTLDALRDDGASSLAEVCRRELDPSRGTAIITEGLLSYFDRASVLAMWRRFAVALAGFRHGVYLSDLHLVGDSGGMRGARVFRALLSAFARGQVHLHFEEANDATAALRDAGFARAAIHRPADFADVDFPGRDRAQLLRIIEASSPEGAGEVLAAS